MDRITGATVDIGSGRRGFRDRNLSLSQAGTIPGATWFNGAQEEIVRAIELMGLTPSDANREQLIQAMRRLAGGNITSLTANASLTPDSSGLILVSAASGNVTLTLSAANAVSGLPQRMTIVRTDTSANTVTVQRAGADTIEGATSLTLPIGARLVLLSDGTGQWVISAGEEALSPPAGSVQFVVGTAAPRGWLKANGALVSRASFPRLWVFAQASGALVSEATWSAGSSGAFSVGDGATTFRLPDLRGEFPRGWDDGRGVDAGRAIGTMQRGTLIGTDESGTPATVDVPRPTWANFNADTITLTDYGSPPASFLSGASTFTPLNNRDIGATRPRNVALLCCIKF